MSARISIKGLSKAYRQRQFHGNQEDSLFEESPPGFMRSAGDPGLYQKVNAGHYVSEGNRSMTVVGSKRNSNSWIRRESVPGKIGGYTAMGMKHFSMVQNKELNVSCYWQLYNEEGKEKSG